MDNMKGMYNEQYEPWHNSKIKHGASHRGHVTKLYRVWGNLKERCLNKASRDYPEYGAKGIGFPRYWLDYAVFRAWCNANGYKEGLIMTRTNKKAGYYPTNIEFVTRQEAITRCGMNKRKFTWRTVQEIRASDLPITTLARIYGVAFQTIYKIRKFVTYKKEKIANV